MVHMAEETYMKIAEKASEYTICENSWLFTDGDLKREKN